MTGDPRAARGSWVELGRWTRPRGPLDVAEDGFTRLISGQQPPRLDGGEIHPGLPDRRYRLDELRDLLFDTDPAPGIADAIWRTVARRVRVDGGDWITGAIGMALPALRHRCKLLATGYRGDRADIDAEMLTGFIHALLTADLDQPRVLDALCEPGRAAARAIRDADARHVPVGRCPRHGDPTVPSGHADLVLDRAVALGVITARDADLIDRTRLDGAELGEVAASSQEKWALQRRRHRAEEKLAGVIRACGGRLNATTLAPSGGAAA